MPQTQTRRDFLRMLGIGVAAGGGAFLVAGCGGGGGGGSSSGGYHPDLARFTPNYGGLITLDHWPTLPVSVFFANDLTATPAGDILPQTVRVNDVIRSGFDRWGTATGGVVGYTVVDNANAAQIVVTTRMIPRPSGLAETGYTQVHADNRGVLTSATTDIYVWPDITIGELLGGQVSTSAHEFGHMLGIAGHSDAPTDLMFVSHAPAQDVPLSVRDVNTVKTIYPSLFP